MEINARLQQLLTAEKLNSDGKDSVIADLKTQLATAQVNTVNQATIDLVAAEEARLSITVTP